LVLQSISTSFGYCLGRVFRKRREALDHSQSFADAIGMHRTVAADLNLSQK
jgi:hypothetical protein